MDDLRKYIFKVFIQLRWARCDMYYIFTVTDRLWQKKTKKKHREWEGMRLILLGVERDRISPQLGRDDICFFLWDGRGLKIHSRVTL